MRNTAKDHRKDKGLADVYKAFADIYNLSLEGVAMRDYKNLMVIRDKAAEQMGKALGLESELSQLDKDSPCIKCRQIGRV